jgi:class 3 adenylate cyclase
VIAHRVTSAETSPSLAAIVADIDGQVPNYRDRTSPDGMMTIAFTDIEGSTSLIEALGERPWLDLMLSHNRIVKECVAAHGGDVVKSQGDGYMVVFASAGAALTFAVRLQHALDEYAASHPQGPLRVRIGLHTGNIFETEEDFLGMAVVIAARITGQARGGEILVSSACREYTERLGLWSFGRPTDLSLKGIAKAQRVYRLEWVDDSRLGAPR